MINENIKINHSIEVRLALLEQAIEFIKNDLKRLEEYIDKLKNNKS